MEILKVIFLGGLPIACISFIMVFWAIKNNYISINDNIEHLKEKKKLAKQDKNEFKINPVHTKWLYFGGGFYGLMALATYVHVEFMEVKDFIVGYSSFSNLLHQITFGALIKLIIDSFMNLIPAFTWFLYWPKIIAMNNGWYWLVASYGGYHLGNYAAKYWIVRQSTLEGNGE